MIVGLGNRLLQANVDERFEWTCEEGQDGELLDVHISEQLAPSILIYQFGLKRASTAVEEHLVVSKRVPAGPGAWATCVHCKQAAPWARGMSCRTCTMPMAPPADSWSGGVSGVNFQALASARAINWDIEVGDTLFCHACNMSSSVTVFMMGVRIGDRTVSKEKHWWANEQTGKLERPVSFSERNLQPGSKRAGLVVVDPETYDGFDEARPT